MGSKPEKICRGDKGKRAGSWRSFVKKQLHKVLRRRGKADPENAPTKKLTRGWST